jgi:hypothetical protein
MADAVSARQQNALADLLGEAVVSTVNGPPPPYPQAAASSAARSEDRMRLLEEKRLQLEEKKKRLIALKAKRAAGTVVAAPAVDSLGVQVAARFEEQATARAPPVAAPSDLDFDLDFDEAPAGKAPAPSPDKKTRSERRSERRSAPAPPPPPVDEFEDEVATIEIGSAAGNGFAADDEFEQEGQQLRRPPQAYSHEKAKAQPVGGAPGAVAEGAPSTVSRVREAGGSAAEGAVDGAGEAAAGEAAAAAVRDREAQQAAVRGAEVRAEEARRQGEAERGASLREEMRQSLRAVQQGAVASGDEDGAGAAEGLGAQQAAPVMKSAREKADENYAAARNNIEAIAEGDEEEEEPLGEGEGTTAKSAEEEAAAAAAAAAAAERAAAERAAAAREAKAAKLDAQFEAATHAADQSRLSAKEQRKAGKTRFSLYLPISACISLHLPASPYAQGGQDAHLLPRGQARAAGQGPCARARGDRQVRRHGSGSGSGTGPEPDSDPERSPQAGPWSGATGARPRGCSVTASRAALSCAPPRCAHSGTARWPSRGSPSIRTTARTSACS